LKPFIHLFETPKNYYFYDVNRNENIQVSKEVYKYLEKMLNDELNENNRDLDIEKQIQNLRQNGYLSDNRVKEIKHPATNLLPYYLNRKLQLLTIQLTHACNLRCSYCPYTSNDGTYRLHENKRINLETIKKALLMLRDNSVDSEDITVGFYGGEPLLEFELIEETVRYCKKIFVGKEVSYTITTNGTLISDEVLELFEKENFQVVISLDGPREINDKNRKFANSNKSVFDKVIKNIIYIKENYKTLFNRISINMVIDPTQDFNKYKLLFEEYPILNNINTSISLVEDDYKTEKYLPTEEFRNDFNYIKFLSYLHYLGEINLNDEHFYINLFYESMNKMWEEMTSSDTLGSIHCPSGPCVPGKTRLMVSVDGLLFPCERISENIPFHCIGSLKDGFSIENTEKIMNIAKTVIEDCKNCFAFRHCTLCVKAHESKTINEDSIKDKCRGVRYDFHNELIGREILNEITMN